MICCCCCCRSGAGSCLPCVTQDDGPNQCRVGHPFHPGVAAVCHVSYLAEPRIRSACARTLLREHKTRFPIYTIKKSIAYTKSKAPIKYPFVMNRGGSGFAYCVVSQNSREKELFEMADNNGPQSLVVLRPGRKEKYFELVCESVMRRGTFRQLCKQRCGAGKGMRRALPPLFCISLCQAPYYPLFSHLLRVTSGLSGPLCHHHAEQGLCQRDKLIQIYTHRCAIIVNFKHFKFGKKDETYFCNYFIIEIEIKIKLHILHHQ